jgi:hypothetical protein
MVLTSLATAIFAASHAVTSNQRYFSQTQTGRLALAQICKAIRTSSCVQIGAATGVTNGSAGSGTALYLHRSATPTSVAYIWDSTHQQLLYDTNPSAPSDSPTISTLTSRMPGSTSTPTVFVLAANVKSLTFSCTYGDPWNSGSPTAVSVNMNMTAGNPWDTSTYTVDQAVIPRNMVNPTSAPAP